MIISRRNLLRRVAATGVATLAAPALRGRAQYGTPVDRPRAGGPAAPGGLIRLDRNENAHGPSAKVLATIRDTAADVARRYPGVSVESLRAGIAAFHAIAPEQVVVGCGSGEILRMAVEAFAGPGKNIVAAVPTCELIEPIADRAGAEIAAVPLNQQYAHDTNAMLARIEATTGLVYICSPNNPTGTLTARQTIEEFVRKVPPTTYVVIDEAYHHYVNAPSDYTSFLDRPLDDPRVIVTRSFSKMYGLAGLCVGYGVASAQTARLLGGTRVLERVNAVGAAAALAALSDSEHVERHARQNADDRQEFFNEANARMLKPIDSHANFVMFDTGRPAIRVIDHFKKNGIAIAGNFPYFAKFVRVSLGTAEEMREFWRVWDLMPRQKMSM
jgi:histidinol-phosphate aminotransferase